MILYKDVDTGLTDLVIPTTKYFEIVYWTEPGTDIGVHRRAVRNRSSLRNATFSIADRSAKLLFMGWLWRKVYTSIESCFIWRSSCFIHENTSVQFTPMVFWKSSEECSKVCFKDPSTPAKFLVLLEYFAWDNGLLVRSIINPSKPGNSGSYHSFHTFLLCYICLDG
jgi:hypothetical protein